MKRILMVEDDKKTARALALRLQAAGYEVWIEAEGRLGLKRAREEVPDLILMDIWLPDGPGFRVAAQLEEVGLGHVPLILMTASSKSDLWGVAQEVGAVAFIQKPYDPERLLAAVARALSGSAGLEGMGPDGAVGVSGNLL